MKRYIKTSSEPEYNDDIIYDCFIVDPMYRKDIINASISSREMSRDMIRVKSSNMWAYKMNVKNYGDKTGDLIVQFKNKNGGPGDIYEIFNVPLKVSNRLITAPSKGHFYAKYIRNTYPYRKLTGDRKGKLPNAIN